MKILLVEDNDFVRTLMDGQLAAAGHEVVAVNDVAEALEALENNTFGLLITDIILPKTDGGQLMRQVRQSRHEMPILAITGGIENAQDDYANYADLFADKTLIKPISKQDLLKAVDDLTRS